MRAFETDRLNANRKASVAAALGWDLSDPIRLLVDRKGMDETHAHEMAHEYRRFLGLIADSPRETFPISEAVDEMWHTHILFTRDYQEMGLELRGTYIGHRPILNEEERVELFPNYHLGTLAAYERLYGEKPPAKWWPTEGAICFSCSSPG